MWNQRFLFLWAGQSLANLGDVFYIVAIISIIFTATDSIFFTSLVPVVNVSMRSLGSLTAPLLFQRFSLQRLLLISQTLKTGLLVIVAIAAIERELLLFILIAAIAYLDGWATPARNALVPRLVSRDRLLRANGLLAASDQTVYFAGWAAGGIAVVWLGAEDVLWGTVAAYAMAAWAMLFIGSTQRTELAEQPEKTSLLTGWQWIRREPRLRLIVMMDVLVALSGGVWIAAIILPFVLKVLGQGEEWWGYINAGYMLGSIVGVTALLAAAQRMQQQLYRWIIIGTIGASVLTVLFASSSEPLAALLFSFMLGPVFQMQLIAKQTVLQQAVSESRLPYVLSAKDTIDSLMFGLSALLMGAFAEWQGPRAVYYLSAVMLGGAVVIAIRLYQARSVESVRA
ncbi:MFS transporter [Brevibacillus invocatus]|uniref:MFS transporter n=1 Tax=Brevibacillus invocatus TaxID=173959 RepID=A0A3M8BUG4_9BACL|nr:MFS transporter [Brevibacillus invocatus]RNB67051.1 MFS transporter [Brevibacillus invocatus]